MPVRVTGVTLDKSSINLTTVWDTEQLTATISPSNAEDTAVTWSSSDTTVATVSDTWLVTCITPWTATITVTTHDWGYTATCGVEEWLPSIYQEVEYIESSGGQYINTWVKASNSISTELVMRPNMSYTSEYAIFGDAWSADALFFMEYNWRYRLHNWGNYWDFAYVTNEKTTISIDNTGITINGTTSSLSAWSSYSNNNIWIFWIGNGGNSWQRWRFKLYSFKIYSSWTLIRDFVPCYLKEGWTIGLYDEVNWVFYTNQWSWSFTKWSDV